MSTKFHFSHFSLFFASLLPILLISCSDSNPASASLEEYTEIISAAKTQVQKIRQLQFIRPVHVGLLTREQYSSYNDDWSTEDASLIMKEFKQIGFIPDNFTNNDFISESNDMSAIAFYKPGTDSLYIIDADTYDPSELYVYTIHELTHALQEQNFNPFTRSIYPTISQSTLNSDFYLSQMCVSEGDATFTMYYAFFDNYFPNSSIDSVRLTFSQYREDFYSSLKKAAIPRYLEIESNAQYTLGSWFIAQNYTNGSWQKINSFYHANRVNSTADIITASTTPLFAFDFSRIMPVLLKNTNKLIMADDDTYGPIMLMSLLNELVDTANCKRAFGWQGDRLAYTLSDNQTYGSFVWALHFATETDAAYITDKLSQFLSTRKLSGVSATTTGTDYITFSSANTSTLLKRDKNNVYWIENIDQKDSILSLLKSTPLAKNITGKSFSTISTDNKRKFIDKLFGIHHG